MRGTASIDAEVYETPSPAAVARLIDSHSLEAACERWHWMGERTLSAMARSARAASGQTSAVVRARSWSDLDAAVAVEAAFALGSVRRGERAAGLTAANAGRGICQARGIEPPCISPEERGRASSIGHAARRGDPDAVAARHAQRAHELEVGSVLRRALALVPEQLSTGRYRLPPVNADLAEALAGLDPAAVALVFPGLAMPEPALAEPEPIVTVPPPIQETRTMAARRRMPTDDVILAERAQGKSASQMAADWEVSVPTVLAHWRRLDEAARDAEAEAAPAPEQPATTTTAAPLPVVAPVWDAGARSACEPLCAEDLARAVELARLTGLCRDDALRWVRSDIAQSAQSKAALAPIDVDAFFADLLRSPEDRLHG